MQLPNLGTETPDEWKVAQQAVADHLADGDVVEAFRQCRTIEVYTDGSAPIANPGGPIGFAVVAVGYRELIDTSQQDRPKPCARIELGDFIAARTLEPQTSNNRAEVAGVLSAFELIRKLGENQIRLEHVYVWSDSNYTVNCGNGDWRRKKNTDLWAAYDIVLDAAQQATGATIELSWVKGHASNEYNGAADELATRAAFNFDEVTYKRFRAAQAVTGREMPGPVALAQHDVKLETRIIDTPTTHSAPEDGLEHTGTTSTGEWRVDTDYAILLLTHLEGNSQQGVGCGSCTGTYRLITNKGRSYQTKVKHVGERILGEGEYLTLSSALEDLTERIKTAGRDPGKFTVTIFSGQELVTKQLTGAYQVKSQLLRPLYEQARSALSRFGRVEIIWKPVAMLKNELR
ncbi:MAG: hypothetical protein M3437_04925 [Chloroflexota bacterium]|nr:hypothetical protein [Chloroflexota bacterium]MDQ5866535.1 hypothetical protein [Chloroflexota bacterium]